MIEESDRAKLYLDAETEPLMLKIVENELINKRMRSIAEMETGGIVNKINNLACIYNSFSRLRYGGLDMLADYVSSYLRDHGKMLLQEKGTDPIAFVRSFWGLKNQFDDFLQNSFNNDEMFKETISSDLKYLLDMDSKHLEYMLLFIDDKLNTGIPGVSAD